jgi:hypothetical protein
MEAKLKDLYRFNKVILFSGYEFIKTDWRPVPAGMEQEAALPEYFLELRVKPMEMAVEENPPKKIAVKLVAPVEASAPEPLAEVAPKVEPEIVPEKETVPKSRGKRGGSK